MVGAGEVFESLQVRYDAGVLLRPGGCRAAPLTRGKCLVSKGAVVPLHRQRLTLSYVETQISSQAHRIMSFEQFLASL